MTTRSEKWRTILGPSRAVLAVRAALLLAAVGLTTAGVSIALRDEAPAAASAAAYLCPMHQDVTSATPGQCPICKMALEPMSKVRSESGASTKEHPPDCPMHQKPEPAASAAVAPPVISDAVAFPGANVSPATGVTWLPETHPPAAHAKPSDRPIVDSPKRRTFVNDVRAPAWLKAPDRLAAVLYRDELIGLSSGERGRFFRARAPRVPIDVRLGDEAATPWDASTTLVELVIEPKQGSDVALGELRSGDVGWLELERRSRELLVIPESALLRSSDGAYVLVPSTDEAGFTRRSLQIGRILKGQVVVLSGLRDEDKVVVGNAFFVDTAQNAESRTGPLAGVAP